MVSEGLRRGRRGFLPDEVAEGLVCVELPGIKELVSGRVIWEAWIALGEIQELIWHVRSEDRLSEDELALRFGVAAGFLEGYSGHPPEVQTNDS
jgi:hypothetical protein